MTKQALGRRALAACALLALAAGCTPQPQPRYVVFFYQLSSDLDPEAQSVVQAAVTAARNAPTRLVTVAGYTDRMDAPGADVQLSRRRAQAVADALAASGVDRARISLQPRGQDREGDPGVERRRVEITLP